MDLSALSHENEGPAAELVGNTTIHLVKKLILVYALSLLVGVPPPCIMWVFSPYLCTGALMGPQPPWLGLGYPKKSKKTLLHKALIFALWWAIRNAWNCFIFRNKKTDPLAIIKKGFFFFG